MLLSYAESGQRPDPRRGHHRGRVDGQLHRGRHRVRHSSACPVVPFYTFYSMFGFQRVGDLIWQAADARTRGFLLGATAGRTTLDGRGPAAPRRAFAGARLDGAALPGLRPCLRLRGGSDRAEGLQRMYGANGVEDPDVFYYITLYNENYTDAGHA